MKRNKEFYKTFNGYWNWRKPTGPQSKILMITLDEFKKALKDCWGYAQLTLYIQMKGKKKK